MGASSAQTRSNALEYAPIDVGSILASAAFPVVWENPMRTLIFGFAGVTAMSCVAFACSSTADDCRETSTCTSAGSASGNGRTSKGGSIGTDETVGASESVGAGGKSGMSGGQGGRKGIGRNDGFAGREDVAGSALDSGAGGESPSGCDVTLTPDAEACLISNEFAVFVAPTGKDANLGTKTSPVNSISKAIQLAGDDKFVIACNGTYDEQLTIMGRARIYGGFACPGSPAPWTYEDGKKAKVAPTARGLALDVAAAASVVEVADFEFDAKDGTDAGESSVAAFVRESTKVVFRRVKFSAGNGVDGANGTRTEVMFPPQSELNGKPASDDNGGDPNARTCPVGGSTRGGRGGDGGGSASSGTAGLPDLGAGKGGTLGQDCGLGGTGVSGADAPPQPASPGATKLGMITPKGWSGAAGTDGTPGIAGQGGGGGAGATMGGGGGGGAGGCGGSGGPAGRAGGSSIALLLFNSTLTMDSVELVSANAGKGGNGVAGQPGQPIGGSAGSFFGDGCAGGKGGKGGAGGAGGGGAGGISVGIAYQGTAPIPAASTITVGSSGTKGLGGVPGTNDGIDGKAQPVLEVP